MTNKELRTLARNLIRESLAKGVRVNVLEYVEWLDGAILDVALPRCSTSKDEHGSWIFRGEIDGKPWSVLLTNKRDSVRRIREGMKVHDAT